MHEVWVGGSFSFVMGRNCPIMSLTWNYLDRLLIQWLRGTRERRLVGRPGGGIGVYQISCLL